MRAEPVIAFNERADGVLGRVLAKLQRVLGKVVSLTDVCLLLSTGGYTVTNAAAGSGTALTFSRTTLDLADAGVDSARLVVRGQNSAAGDVTVQAYNVTQSAALATATVSGATEQTAEGAWTALTPVGGDEEVEVRVVGDGVFDPVLYAVHLQLRTTQVRV